MSTEQVQRFAERLSKLTGVEFQVDSDLVTIPSDVGYDKLFVCKTILDSYGIIIPDDNGVVGFNINRATDDFNSELEEILADKEPARIKRLEEGLKLLNEVSSANFAFDKNHKLLVFYDPSKEGVAAFDFLKKHEIIDGIKICEDRREPRFITDINIEKLKGLRSGLGYDTDSIAKENGWVDKIKLPLYVHKNDSCENTPRIGHSR